MMPELPDVAGFLSYLNATGLHQTICRTTVTDKRALEDISARALAIRLKQTALKSARRHGKYLFVELTRADNWLVFHFGMTGHLAYYKAASTKQPEHARVILFFENGYALAYVCQRMLGRVTTTPSPDEFITRKALGPDALDIGQELFVSRLRSRRGAVKSALTNQSVVAGIGNIYGDEILFQAQLHPKTKLTTLSRSDLRDLHTATHQILQVAADNGGQIEEISDQYFAGHREDSGACPRCGTQLSQIKVNNRTTYFCENCQPKTGETT